MPFFSLKFEKKDGQDYEPESLAFMQCSLDRHLKNYGRNHSILRDREFANSRQLLALSEADKHFLWSSGHLILFYVILYIFKIIYKLEKCFAFTLHFHKLQYSFSSIILILFAMIMAFYSAEYLGNKNNAPINVKPAGHRVGI